MTVPDTTTSDSAGLRHLVRAADDLLADGPPPSADVAEVMGALADILGAVLEDPDLLPGGIGSAPPPDGFGKYLLHAAPSFVVFSTVTAPEVAAPIHDHGSWGIVGLRRGTEEEVRYRLRPERAGGLAAAGRTAYSAGDVMVVEPPPHDIHQVFNTCNRATVSVHLFLCDPVASGFRVWAAPDAPAGHTGPLRYDEVPALGPMGAA